MCIVIDYIKEDSQFPLFVQGDSLDVLRKISDNSIDCCITSPPYWQKRQYENGGIGLEASPTEYIESLYAIIKEIKRVQNQAVLFGLISETLITINLLLVFLGESRFG